MQKKLQEKVSQYFIVKKKRDISEILPRSHKLLSREERDDIVEHKIWHSSEKKPKKYLRVNSQT